MKVLYAGHIYTLADKDGSVKDYQLIRFSNREPGTEGKGTTSQELLRVLIDRTRYCNNCLPHPNNERIIYHLRMALTLHESRALERKVEKGGMRPEYVPTANDGHFELAPTGAPVHDQDLGEITEYLQPWKPDWERECVYPDHDKDEDPIWGGA